MFPKYEKCPMWDGATMSTVDSKRKYRMITLVTTDGTITAFEDKTTGILTLSPEAFEASLNRENKEN